MRAIVLVFIVATSLADFSKTLFLKAGPVNTQERPSLFDSFSEKELSGAKDLFYLQLQKQHASYRSDFVQRLKSNFDILPIRYIPQNTWIVLASKSELYRLSNTTEVVWIGPVSSQDKIAVTPENRSQVFYVNIVPHLFDVKQSLRHCEKTKSSFSSIANVSLSCVGPSRIRVLAQSETFKTWERFAQDPQVLFIEPEIKFFPFNKFSWRVLFGNETVSSSPYHSSFVEEEQVPWGHKLMGQNQVVGVSDTGLDITSCFFAEEGGKPYAADPFVEWKKQPSTRDYYNPAAQKNRKVVQYVRKGSAGDQADGHGTHVSGSVAGHPWNFHEKSSPLLEFSGIARHAKIAFFDLSTETADGKTGALEVPEDANNGMLKWLYEGGARIITNSWGSNEDSYTLTARDFDQFMYENKDALLLSAAGNSGMQNELRTLGSPSTCKNGLSVGASLNTRESMFATLKRHDRFGPVLDAFKKFLDVDKLGIESLDDNNVAFWSSMGPTSDNRVKPDILAPGMFIWSAKSFGVKGGESKCAPKDVLDEVLINQGTSMASPTLAGGMAVIRQWFTEGYYPSGSAKKQHRLIPSGALMKNMALHGALPLTGSKMYVCKEENANESRVCRSNLSVDPQSIWMQGFGKAQLHQSIFFAEDRIRDRYVHIPSLNASSGKDNLYDRTIDTDEEHVYEFCVFPSSSTLKEDRFVRISLVWTDPPATLSAGIALVNDLDLEAEYLGERHTGNEKFADAYSRLVATTFWSQDTKFRDRINNAEKIVLETPAHKSALKVSVRGHNVPSEEEQTYTLVVSGPVAAGSCSAQQSPEPAPWFQ